MNEHFYDVHVTWEGERKGSMRSDVLPTAIEVATPPEFPKGMSGIWSPEHLFVAAVNSCLMTTFLAIAENSRLEYESFTSDAVGKLEQVDGKFLMSEVVLKPRVTIRRQEDYDRALRVIQKSEAACLISNSVKSKIVMQPLIEVV